MEYSKEIEDKVIVMLPRKTREIFARKSFWLSSDFDREIHGLEFKELLYDLMNYNDDDPDNLYNALDAVESLIVQRVKPMARMELIDELCN
jgi:hypothetical protein